MAAGRLSEAGTARPEHGRRRRASRSSSGLPDPCDRARAGDGVPRQVIRPMGESMGDPSSTWVPAFVPRHHVELDRPAWARDFDVLSSIRMTRSQVARKPADCSVRSSHDGWLPRMAPKRQKVQQPFDDRNPRSRRGFGSTPGETRTPNLLIRRSPSGVHGCPQPYTQPETKGSRFHQRPQPSSLVHGEWLPTWLPSGHGLFAQGSPNEARTFVRDRCDRRPRFARPLERLPLTKQTQQQ